MTTLKVQYERSGFVWYTEVTLVKSVLPMWDVKDEAMRLDPVRGLQTHPGAEQKTMWDRGVTLTEDVVQSADETFNTVVDCGCNQEPCEHTGQPGYTPTTPCWADHAIPTVIHQGVFGTNQQYAHLAIVRSKATPDPYREFGVIVPSGYAWLMNDQGDTIDRI